MMNQQQDRGNCISTFKGELHPKLKLTMIVHYLKIIFTSVKNSIIVLQQIVWES